MFVNLDKGFNGVFCHHARAAGSIGANKGPRLAPVTALRASQAPLPPPPLSDP